MKKRHHNALGTPLPLHNPLAPAFPLFRRSTPLFFTLPPDQHRYTNKRESVYNASSPHENEMYLFERFKMQLYEAERGVPSENIKQVESKENENKAWGERNMKTHVRAANKKTLEAGKVFSEALRFIKEHALEYTKKKFAITKIDDIQWILTVPAIWTGKAKARMKRWVEDAGMIYKGARSIQDHLIIAYEPDC